MIGLEAYLNSSNPYRLPVIAISYPQSKMADVRARQTLDTLECSFRPAHNLGFGFRTFDSGCVEVSDGSIGALISSLVGMFETILPCLSR